MEKKSFLMTILVALSLCLVVCFGVKLENKQNFVQAETSHNHNDVEFTEWTQTDSLPTTAGNYYLSSDVNLTSEWNTCVDISICLNGHAITQTNESSSCNVINVKADSLSVYDCSVSQTGKITHKDSTKGRGVYISDGTFNLYGGSIENNSETNGAGVYIFQYTTFYMYGGSIKNNTSSARGGGIYVSSGNCHLYGGEITENTAQYEGGGVHYIGGSKGLMYLGGKLVIDQNTCTNNSSKNNLYVAGSYYPQIKSTCVLTDGSKIEIFAKISSGETELPVVYLDSTLSASDYLQYFYSDSTDYVTYADTENCAISLKYQHSHNFSESKICSCGVYSSDGGTTLFTEFSESLLVSGALATGNYYLASDITLSSAIKIQSSANVKIALNGKTLNLGEKFINVDSGCTLSIIDTDRAGLVESTYSYYTIFNKGTLELDGVRVSGASIKGKGSTSSNAVVANYDNSTATISNCLIENTANGYAVLKYQLATISISDSDIISPLCGIYMCSTGGYVYLSGNTTVNGEEYDIYHDKGTISAKNKDQTVSLFTNDTITIKFYEPKSSGVRLIFNVEETNKDVFSLILTDDDKAKVDSLIYDSTNKRLVTHQHTFENGTCQETTCGQKLTGKDSSGLFYVNGVLANGIYENVYYENGLLFTGTTNGIYYVDGYPANGVYDNLYYENGVISTGTYDGKYYVDGVLAQGEIGDNYYIDGVLHTHTYDSDNGHTCSCGWHKHDTEIYKVFDGSTLTLTSGNYYLAENISLTSYNQTLTIGKSATVNFCLNGHTITFGTNAENKFSVVQYATLNLCDCQKTGKIIGNVVGAVISTYGTTTISDVEIINQNTANNIKNSAITNGGVLTIQSGKITGSGKWGIYNFKTVNIAGGEISAPYAVYNGQIMCNTYIYGSPTISGTYADIYVYCGTTSDPNYYYLTNEDGTKAYEGGSLSVGVVNDDYASTLGREIIKNVSETQKDLFSLTEENEYKLVYFEQSLYMHKHVFDSTWTTDSSVHYHACQVAYCDIENYSLYADANYSEHSFDNDCDATCNICSYEREITHTGSPTKYVCNNDGTHNVVYTCCGAVYVENEQCTIKYDDKDCTTADYCFCGYVISPAKQHTFDNDCDENCNNTGCNYTREISHEPNDDDNDCTTEVVCKICGTITTPAQSQHNFVYNTSEYLITRNCSNANCQHSESATLNLQSEYVYDKNVDVKDTIKVNYLDNWTGDKFSLTFKKDGAVVSTCINAGSYEISLKLSDTELGFGFIIQKANYDLSNISFESKTLTYDGQKHSLKISGELPSGVSVEYSKTDMCDVNTYDVIAYFFGDTENYNEIECKNALLEIQKAQLKITANDDTITYGDEPKSNGATFSGFVQDENESYLLGELQYTFSYQKYANVGEYSIIITGYESNNYEIEYIQGKLIVSPKDISFANVMFEDNLTYNKSVQTLQVTSVQIDGLYATFSVSGNQGTNAGDYTLVVTGTGNYVGTVEKLWHIQQAVVQIPNSQQNLVYDGSEKVGVLETEFYTVENGKGVLAGDYHATVTLKDENNYRWNATFAEIIWSIQKAEPVVPTAPIIERELIYGQQLCEIQPSDGWLFMDVDRYKSPKVNESQNLFKMRYKVDTDNYNWENFVNNDMYAYENGYCYTYVKVTIKKASYYMHDVIFEDKTFVEDGQMKELAISGNLPKGVSVTYVNNGQSQVGEYVVIAKFTGDSENYNAIKDMTAKITINRASLTQTLDNEGDGTLEVIITKNGGIAPNIQLVIKKQNTISETIKKAIEKTEQVSFIYDIKLQNGDESVQPDGEITIKLSILSELNNKTFRLLHIHNNSVEQLKYEVQDGYAVFTVENLSEFAFITDAPKSTFSLNWLFLIIPIGLIFMLGVYVVIKKKLFIKR